MLISARPVRRARGALRHAAVVLFALIALGWQGLVTQTHFHLRGETCITLGNWTDCVQPARTTPHDRTGPDQDSGCLLCHELALSGHYIMPAAVIIVPPAPVAFWLAKIAVQPDRPLPRSHIWQSRAPPVRAQS